MLPKDSTVLTPMVVKLAKRSRLGDEERRALMALPFKLARFERDRYLVREGDKAEHCALLVKGYVHRSKIAGSGAQQILSVHLRGDLVDLQNSLLGEADHNVQAITRVEVALIPQQEIVRLAEEYPAIARALWRDTLVDGSIFREWILNVGQRDARQRISHLMCEIVLRQEEAGLCQGPWYDWPMTQTQVGEATGLTSVHVNRTMQQMRRDQLIATGGRLLNIPDWSALKSAGDFSKAYLHQAAAVAA